MVDFFSEIKQFSTDTGILFPEFILDIPDDDSSINSSDNETFDGVDVNNSNHNSKFSVEELEQQTAGIAQLEDCLFDKFKKSIKQHPKQVWLTDTFFHLMNSCCID